MLTFALPGTPQNGLEQFYNFADALAMASWLNVFVRQADVVDIACIAQSVNVISPLITRYVARIRTSSFAKADRGRSPTGLFRQTIYWPLYLFSRYMRDGTAVKLSLDSLTFAGETLPQWISTVKGQPNDLDASAVLHVDAGTGARSLRVAVVNRSEHEAYDVPIRVAFEHIGAEVEVHELWHQDVRARNGWGKEDEVSVKTRTAKWDGRWTFREHSFTLLVLSLQ